MSVMRTRLALLGGLGFAILAVLPSHAQEPGTADPADDPCLAIPEGEDLEGVDDEALAELLERCDGVLRPPPLGAPEMVEPPPDAGTTPVIRPEDLPEEQPVPGDTNT